MILKDKPSSEPLHNSVKKLFLVVCSLQVIVRQSDLEPLQVMVSSLGLCR